MSGLDEQGVRIPLIECKSCKSTRLYNDLVPSREKGEIILDTKTGECSIWGGYKGGDIFEWLKEHFGTSSYKWACRECRSYHDPYTHDSETGIVMNKYFLLQAKKGKVERIGRPFERNED